VDGIDPTNKLIRADGELLANGWINKPEVETGGDAWYEAGTFEAEAVCSVEQAPLTRRPVPICSI
jgi:hypothetical protein